MGKTWEHLSHDVDASRCGGGHWIWEWSPKWHINKNNTQKYDAL